MFANNVAAAIKAAGKILKEKNGTFFLPFGQEYSVYLKNLNSIRILAKVEIDGVDVGDGTQFVIQPNSSFELERFVKNGNFEQGNKLKFIERTGKVEAHRGIQIEDGLIRIEFQKEKVTPKPIVVETIHKHYDEWYKYYPLYDPWKPYYPYYPYGPYYKSYCSNSLNDSSQLIGSAGLNNAVNAGVGSINTVSTGFPQNSSGADCSITTTSAATGPVKLNVGGQTRSRKLTKSAVGESQMMNQAVNDAGITVAGSVSDQKFQTAAWFAVDDEKFVIVLKLLGEVGGQVVEQAITTKSKQVCDVCGTRNRGKLAQFCRECGNALQII